MKNNYNIFYAAYLLKKNYSSSFYRMHFNFFLNLLKYMVSEKKLFLLHKTIFFHFILKCFHDYAQKQYYNKESYYFLNNLILNIKQIQKQNNYSLYSYLLSLIGIILYFSCYNIAIASIPSYNENEENQLTDLIEALLKKYEYKPKIVFITKNQQLKKGIMIAYKNYTVDLTLKKLHELLNNKITLNIIGEL